MRKELSEFIIKAMLYQRGSPSSLCKPRRLAALTLWEDSARRRQVWAAGGLPEKPMEKSVLV